MKKRRERQPAAKISSSYESKRTPCVVLESLQDVQQGGANVTHIATAHAQGIQTFMMEHQAKCQESSFLVFLLQQPMQCMHGAASMSGLLRLFLHQCRIID